MPERSYEQQRALAKRVLGNPEAFPEEFKAWIASYLQSNPNIVWERSQIPDLMFSEVGRTLATTPPSSPQLGDLWIYPGSGFYWAFIYDPTEATYKWKFIGGPPLSVAIATDETFTDDGTFHDPATAGPTVTLPRAGDYVVEGRCDLYYAVQGLQRAIGFGALPSSGAWESAGAGGTTAFGSGETSAGRSRSSAGFDILRGASASATVKMQYFAEADAGTAHARWRLLKATPIRVI